ncbi:MAG: ORF6N domain-containing protein, partial [Ignavibacteriae bacterium]|nr:ORF6N domain-containing protein [Ignavibacteriota bacterium]
LDRFPEDFMYRLTPDEFESLRFHFGTSKKGRGGRRYLPYVFTELGVAMLSSILKSRRAVQINILIMRAFVRLRVFLATHKDLAIKLDEIEKKLQTHDVQIRGIIEAIRQMMLPPEKPKRPMGFRLEEPKTKYTVKRR